MQPENTLSAPQPLAPVANLIERSFARFTRLFSVLFPWLVLFCLGGFMMVLAQGPVSLWQELALALVGIVVVLASYLAQARVVAGVESEPKDIIGNGRRALAIFFPYLWVVIIQSFIFLGGGIILLVPFIIFSVYLAVILFVFVVENRRGLEALTHSWGYVAGRWWAMLWRMLVLIFLVLIVTALLGIILNLILGPSASSSASLGAALVEQLVSAFLIGPWLLCYLFELYQDLRTTKPVPSTADESTARLWLVIFLTIGIIAALLFAFGAVTHTAAHGVRGLYH